MEVVVRQLLEQDYEEAGKIFYETFGPDGCGEQWTPETSFQHIKENCWSPSYDLCAEIEGKMVGILISFPLTREDGTDLFIDTIAVRSSEQGKGVGQELWNAAENRAKENKLAGIRLLANAHLPSYRWYKKMGLTESGWVELAKKL